jgi:hypothetical protein
MSYCGGKRAIKPEPVGARPTGAPPPSISRQPALRSSQARGGHEGPVLRRQASVLGLRALVLQQSLPSCSPMTMSRRTSLALPLLFHSVGWPAAPTPIHGSSRAFRIGGVNIAVPWPAGYMDMAVAEPILLSEPVGSSSPAMRWVAQYMSVDLLTASPEQASDSACSDFFALQVHRRAEATTLTQEDFDKIRKATAQIFGPGANMRDPRLWAEFPRIERSISARARTRVRMKIVGLPRASLDTQQSKLVQFTVSYKVSLSTNRMTESLEVATSTGLIFVKGKFLTLRRLRMGNSDSEVDAARSDLDAWARLVLASN